MQDSCINVSIAALNENLVGHELKKVWRDGFSLCFQFKNHSVLEINLSNSTEFQIIMQNQEVTAGLLDFSFSGGQIISVKDCQQLSRFDLNPVALAVPDVLSKEMSVDYLMNLFSETEVEVKSLLIDQKVIRGIDQAYADEILWFANISPFSIVSRIPKTEVRILHKTIKYVLQDLIKQARKLDLFNDKQKGLDLLMIHNAKKKCSPTGKVIKMKMNAQLTTYYTDEQTLFV
ncbi:formamidopyrimidine-DNA glycosylase [Pedobacter sp. PACM 27299]|uniref:formamidopyrimidine-DNA glycosylase n=1 Tax=Pedobacter sp. PACM 27299 TaxID=1727164 RepID=UPI0018D1841B|nr:formamidopyrimidine-DNA glycosylase [Pedobacter sp. PACM 27299]